MQIFELDWPHSAQTFELDWPRSAQIFELDWPRLRKYLSWIGLVCANI